MRTDAIRRSAASASAKLLQQHWLAKKKKEKVLQEVELDFWDVPTVHALPKRRVHYFCKFVDIYLFI